jgi:hypothetical protein
MRPLLPGTRLRFCLRHALTKLLKKLAAIASPVRQSLHVKFHALLYRVHQRKSLRLFALGQRLRHFAGYGTAMAGRANGERVWRWCQDKKAGWYNVAPSMPVNAAWQWKAKAEPEREWCVYSESVIS